MVKEVLVGHHVVGVVALHELEDNVGDVPDRLAESVSEHAGDAYEEEQEGGEAEYTALVWRYGVGRRYYSIFTITRSLLLELMTKQQARRLLRRQREKPAKQM